LMLFSGIVRPFCFVGVFHESVVRSGKAKRRRIKANA
jgi:hypothetical protein